MITEFLRKLFNRDLESLIKEINDFKNEDHLWSVKKGITNSAGNLAFHLCGNLKHFIGAVLGNTGYVRQREIEFTAKNVPAAELVKNIEETKAIVTEVLQNLSTQELEATYPLTHRDQTYTTVHFLLHLHAHLNYHLGQINYLRRILDES